MQLFQNGICAGGPTELLAVGVVVFDELIDALHEFLDAGERAATDGLFSDQGEEALDLIEGGSTGWDEVEVPARATGQPRIDFGMAVLPIMSSGQN